MRLYLWNAAVGQSFRFPLQTVEVALRNAVNDALIAIFGDEWWKSPSCRTHLGPNRRSEIDKAETRIRNVYGIVPNTDQIMASLMFGFWAALTNTRYDRIWPARRFAALPNLPANTSFEGVARTAEQIQNLRNRIFHHEPLLGRDLLDDYAQISNLLGWICPQTNVWMRKNSCAPAVVRERP
ncbi:MAG TPA: hypothetical protein VG889_08645 [Rhizomicrobium sp.]|nr:hypothetical protein [Rhizomicrobium sp.]